MPGPLSWLFTLSQQKPSASPSSKHDTAIKALIFRLTHSDNGINMMSRVRPLVSAAYAVGPKLEDANDGNGADGGDGGTGKQSRCHKSRAA
ncbi:unnamed protein product [Fusarium graminearum]|uniref:Uncharacterized protein n=1 Tax=Gibberella zeae TaxID=5518 RepID=A0A9N8RM66_GIBZA|nr:unnamed protein product [Fusarium graminearum]